MKCKITGKVMNDKDPPMWIPTKKEELTDKQKEEQKRGSSIAQIVAEQMMQRGYLVSKSAFEKLAEFEVDQKVLDELFSLFQKIDSDGSGELTNREVAVFWGRCFEGSRHDCFQVLAALDADGNGLVSWDEFVSFFQLTAQTRKSNAAEQEILDELKDHIFGHDDHNCFKAFAEGRRRLSSG